ncbi:MAG TPA: alpha/beta fold hydrolase [Thermoanaerobaculia bacterium]|nr:alpha/beta fold hydrolase [Thermoanaerobaculia bacterium]
MTAPRIHLTPRFTLESGEVLRDVRQAYVLEGALNQKRDNAVLVFHSLTGSPDTLGGWKGSVIGPGKAIDTNRWAVLCPNLLGSCYGTTFKRSLRKGERADAQPAGTTRNQAAFKDFLRRGGRSGAHPSVSTRDQARLIHLLIESLGISSLALVTGGSLGGMVALEFVASFPERARAAAVFGAPVAHSAWALGWSHVQRQAIEAAGPAAGLALARMVGMLTYRSAEELEARFARLPGEGATFAVQSYLTHHGAKLLARFDVQSYLTLLDAMDAHDVGRGRGGAAAALRAFRGRLEAVGITSDALYPEAEVRRWARDAGAELRTIVSPHGHDAFLLETGPVGTVLAEVLETRGAPEAGREALSPEGAEEEAGQASSSSAAAP